MILNTTLHKMCINSAYKHLLEIKEDLCGSAGPLNSKQEEVMSILSEAWDKINEL